MNTDGQKETSCRELSSTFKLRGHIRQPLILRKYRFSVRSISVSVRNATGDVTDYCELRCDIAFKAFNYRL